MDDLKTGGDASSVLLPESRQENRLLVSDKSQNNDNTFQLASKTVHDYFLHITVLFTVRKNFLVLKQL